MILWPWVFFGVVKGKHGIQMNNQLSDNVARHPHQVGAIVTFIGTINRLIATLLFGKAVVRLGQEMIARGSQPEVTVFGVSALLAFRHMTMVWGMRQWGQLVKGKGRLAVVALLLASLGALALIPSGTANLITPGQFNKTAELKGTELDFTSSDPQCTAWFAENQVTNDCDWQDYKNTSFTTCLGENQMLDVLDSGRANMLSAIGSRIENQTTSSFNQLGAEGGIRFLGSPKGVLPIGPDGIPAFDTLQAQANPFADSVVRGGIVSYNYTLRQQGLETMVNCSYDPTSTPILYEAVPDLNSTLLISTVGTCDAANGLEPVLKDVVQYMTLNTNNTLTFWGCKQPPSQGSPDPTYFIYLRGRVNYRTSIGNVTCRVSPLRARDFDVTYHSIPNYFTSQAALSGLEESSQRQTYSTFTDSMLVGFGNIIWEGQNWASNLFAEAVFSMGVKNLGVPSTEPSDTHLRLFEAMIQGVLEYEGTYSRLVYSLGLGNPPPETCLRTINGNVVYSVRGWYIDDVGAQAGLLMPMFLINLTSLCLLFACFIMGQFRYTYDFDATDSMALLTALVVNVRRGRDGTVEWHNKVHYEVDRARG
ncbi:hypothetical protein MD484_g7641, partial [Candolleomyces efflorescens]